MTNTAHKDPALRSFSDESREMENTQLPRLQAVFESETSKNRSHYYFRIWHHTPLGIPFGMYAQTYIRKLQKTTKNVLPQNQRNKDVRHHKKIKL
jgi:hypothetical protein